MLEALRARVDNDAFMQTICINKLNDRGEYILS